MKKGDKEMKTLAGAIEALSESSKTLVNARDACKEAKEVWETSREDREKVYREAFEAWEEAAQVLWKVTEVLSEIKDTYEEAFEEGLRRYERAHLEVGNKSSPPKCAFRWGEDGQLIAECEAKEDRDLLSLLR